MRKLKLLRAMSCDRPAGAYSQELAKLKQKRARILASIDIIGKEDARRMLDKIGAARARIKKQMDREAASEAARKQPWKSVAEGVTSFGNGRSRAHPSAAMIANAQRHLWSKRLHTKANALTHCWACLRPEATADLAKAHIHPVRFGGGDAPWNFFLLCAMCHDHQDDDASRAEQLRWLRKHPVSELVLRAKAAGGASL